MERSPLKVFTFILAALVAAGCGNSEGNALEAMTPAQQKKAVMGGPIPPDVQKQIAASAQKATQEASTARGR